MVAQTSENVSWIDDVRPEICKFVKVQDRLLAVGSILLKSHAFHQIETSFIDCRSGSGSHYREIDIRSMVVLPRTEHGKPYIPIGMLSSNNRAAVDSESELLNQAHDRFPLSVSHQFPYVASSLLLQPSAREKERQLDVLVGMDIVMFESFNPKLYRSISEFISVFESSFGPNEYALIQKQSGDNQLNEFYLRWAVKESYTKAYGLGLGYNFASFEVCFDFDEEGHSSYKSLWEAVERGPRDEFGGVQLKACSVGGQIEPRVWYFWFLPLSQPKAITSETNSMSRDVDSSHLLVNGCLCVALGCRNTTANGSKKPPPVKIEWITTFKQLVGA